MRHACGGAEEGGELSEMGEDDVFGGGDDKEVWEKRETRLCRKALAWVSCKEWRQSLLLYVSLAAL
eukprot:12884741-Prorocentrum_lima.AAC.1